MQDEALLPAGLPTPEAGGSLDTLDYLASEPNLL